MKEYTGVQVGIKLCFIRMDSSAGSVLMVQHSNLGHKICAVQIAKQHSVSGVLGLHHASTTVTFSCVQSAACVVTAQHSFTCSRESLIEIIQAKTDGATVVYAANTSITKTNLKKSRCI